MSKLTYRDFRVLAVMKKIFIILIAIGFILSCKFLDKVEEQKADIIISLDYSQLNNSPKISKVKSTEINAASIDKASIVIFKIDYSYSSISNYQVDTNIQSDADNWTGYWIPYVQGQLNDISSNKCTQEESSNLSISGSSATGQFTLEPGVYNILVGLFENSDLKYVGASNIIDLRAGDSETITIYTVDTERITTPYIPTGSSTGTTGTTYTYTTGGSASNLGHDVEYQFNWGDDSYADWYSNSSATHSWDGGTYNVRVHARCAIHTNIASAWSNGLTVTITAPVEIVTFPDANFEALIRETLNKPTGDITSDDLESITELQGWFKNIVNISGIEYCTNLESLDLFASLITDLSTLSGLTNLISIDLGENTISDVNALSGLINLNTLRLSYNLITDISPLNDLVGLNVLILEGNQIIDIYPLVQNSGIDSGDDVNLINNPLSYLSISTYIPQLEARGVTVNYTAIKENVTCVVCHSDNNLESIANEFTLSQHSSGTIAVEYAGGRATCARCHSHEGFVQFANGLEAVDVANPNSWECSTCHGLHQIPDASDAALRLIEPIVSEFDSDIIMDLNGNSNLCANCHQSRRAEPNITNPGDTFTITSTHYSSHHGPQANVVYGVGFAEIGGPVAYPTASSSYHLSASCTGCHMHEYNNSEGGHSFIASLDACNACHVTANFDYGGMQTEIQNLLAELRDLLITAGVLETDIDNGYIPVLGEHAMTLTQAFFNWMGLEEDRSLGVHNPRYVHALLINSINAID